MMSSVKKILSFVLALVLVATAVSLPTKGVEAADSTPLVATNVELPCEDWGVSALVMKSERLHTALGMSDSNDWRRFESVGEDSGVYIDGVKAEDVYFQGQGSANYFQMIGLDTSNYVAGTTTVRIQGVWKNGDTSFAVMTQQYVYNGSAPYWTWTPLESETDIVLTAENLELPCEDWSSSALILVCEILPGGPTWSQYESVGEDSGIYVDGQKVEGAYFQGAGKDGTFQVIGLDTASYMAGTTVVTIQGIWKRADAYYSVKTQQYAYNGVAPHWSWTVIEEHEHTLWHVEAKAQSCTKAGNIEYWYCSSCGKYYSDEACQNEIGLVDTVIAAGHSHVTTVVKAGFGKDGSTSEKCVCGDEKNAAVIAAPATITVASKTYNKKTQTVAVVVKDRQGKVIPASEYTVTGNTGKSIGKYTVKVTFKNTSEKYTGSKEATWQILPKTTKLKTVKGAKKSLKVTWKKQTSGTKGYKIQIATDKNFKKGVKTYTVKKNKTTSYTIKKLKAKKKYYVRICTYKGSYYSEWSAKKSAKTK